MALTFVNQWDALVGSPHPTPVAQRPPKRLALSPDSSARNGGIGLALLLAALAGWVDVAGAAGSGGLFLSFMSGNTANIARSLIHEHWMKVEIIGAVLGLFVTGVFVGELLEPLGGRFGACLVLTAETIALACGVALYWHGTVWLAPLALFKPYPLVVAMGLQNATMRRARGVSIGLTYVTGTLVEIGRALADMARRRGGGRRAAEHSALWLSLACGASIGALALSASPVAALLIAMGTAGTLAVATAFTRTAALPPQI